MLGLPKIPTAPFCPSEVRGSISVRQDASFWKRLAAYAGPGLALAPAFIGVAILGEHSVGQLLGLSQVVLSLQLPFALVPLVRFTGSSRLMGSFANGRPVKKAAWALVLMISAANLRLVLSLF